MTFDVVGFGALNLDKLYQVDKIARKDDESYIKDLKISCGGSAANTLIGLTRLGLNTALIGKVSQDDEGKLLLKNLKGEGVDVRGIILSAEGRSGSVIGFVDEEGQRALYVDPGVNDTIKPNEIDYKLASDTKIMHLTSFVSSSLDAQEALLEVLPKEVKVSFDPGRLYAKKGVEYLANILSRTDMLLLNREELKLLTHKKYKTIEEEIESISSFDIDIVVVKLGEDGCYAHDGVSAELIKAFPVKCRDTTGAGDAFNAGFLYGFLKGNNLQESCVMGNYVAGCSVESYGTTKGLPDEETLKKFISKF